jgi:hypothetical protein
MIGLAAKAQDEVEGVEAEKARHGLRREFWEMLLPMMNGRSSLFRNISPGTKNWIGTGSGTRGISFNFVVRREAVRVDAYIDTGDGDLNEAIFDDLHADMADIAAQFGEPLIWERLEGKRACRIKAQRNGNIFDRDQWPTMIDYMVDAMIRLDQTFRGRITELSNKLTQSSSS